MANVKKIGNKSESVLLEILKNKGYWCHLFSYNDSGQPCDVIALKGDYHYLIDVKHCDSDVFYFSRIESNQHNCFRYANECGVAWKNLGFAIYSEITKDFHWLPYSLVIGLKEDKRVLIQFLERLSNVL